MTNINKKILIVLCAAMIPFLNGVSFALAPSSQLDKIDPAFVKSFLEASRSFRFCGHQQRLSDEEVEELLANRDFEQEKKDEIEYEEFLRLIGVEGSSFPLALFGRGRLSDYILGGEYIDKTLVSIPIKDFFILAENERIKISIEIQPWSKHNIMPGMSNAVMVSKESDTHYVVYVDPFFYNTAKDTLMYQLAILYELKKIEIIHTTKKFPPMFKDIHSFTEENKKTRAFIDGKAMSKALIEILKTQDDYARLSKELGEYLGETETKSLMYLGLSDSLISAQELNRDWQTLSAEVLEVIKKKKMIWLDMVEKVAKELEVDKSEETSKLPLVLEIKEETINNIVYQSMVEMYS